MNKTTFLPLIFGVLLATACATNAPLPVSSEQARNVATALYPDATPVRVELTTNNGRRAWDVELDNRWAVYVDALTGDVIEVERVDVRDDDDTDAPSDTSAAISAVEAQRIALALYPDANAIDTDLEVEDGRRVWDVELDNGVSVYVDVMTGEVVEVEYDDDVGGNPGDDPGNSDLISADQAADIALSRFPNATVIDVDLGEEDGRQVWYVDLSNGYEVYIDAITGDILDIERD